MVDLFPFNKPGFFFHLRREDFTMTLKSSYWEVSIKYSLFIYLTDANTYFQDKSEKACLLYL